MADGTAGMGVEATSCNFHNRRYPFREKWLDARHIVGNPPLHVAPSVSPSPYELLSCILQTTEMKGQPVVGTCPDHHQLGSVRARTEFCLPDSETHAIPAQVLKPLTCQGTGLFCLQ